jgi:DNA-binding cell septation regulator SpoVG
VDAAQNYIKDLLKLSNNFIPVLAKEKIVGTKTDNGIKIKPYNLDKLTEVSIDLAKSAVESSCYQGLIEDIKKTISEEITNLTKGIKKCIDIDIKNTLNKMNLNSKIEDLYNDNTNIIFNIFYKYIFLDSNLEIVDYNNPVVKIGENDFSISKDSQIAIKGFVTDYFENILESYKKNLNELVDKYSNELSNEIIRFQVEFNQKKDNLLQTPWTIEQLKVMINLFIYEKISKKIELIVLKNSFVYLINPIIEKFGNYFIEMYNQGLEDKKFKEYAKKLMPSSFDAIEKKVKEYYERKNKEEAPTPLEETTNETQNVVAGLRDYDDEEEDENDI